MSFSDNFKEKFKNSQQNGSSILDLLDQIHNFSDGGEEETENEQETEMEVDDYEDEVPIPLPKIIKVVQEEPKKAPILPFKLPPGITIKRIVKNPEPAKVTEVPEPKNDPFQSIAEPEVNIDKSQKWWTDTEVEDVDSESESEELESIKDEPSFDDSLPFNDNNEITDEFEHIEFKPTILPNPKKSDESPKAQLILKDLQKIRLEFIQKLQHQETLICHFCEETFELVKLRHAHELENHLNLTKFTLNNEISLKKEESEIKLFWNSRLFNSSLSCFFCGEFFTSETCRFYHEKVTHLPEMVKNFNLIQKFQCACDVCGQIFMSTLDLKIHFASEHQIGKNFSSFDDELVLIAERFQSNDLHCLFCGKVFLHKIRRLNHEKFVHFVKPEFDDIFHKDEITICSLCDFSSKDTLKTLNHFCLFKEDRLTVSEPINGFLELSEVEKEQERQESCKRSGIKCKFCHKIFYEKYKRILHEHKFHLGLEFYTNSDPNIEKIGTKFECKDCKATFTRLYDAKHHFENQHLEKLKIPFVIKTREYSEHIIFADSQEHFDQINEIIKDATFECQFCGRHFEERNIRVFHQYRVHFNMRCKCLKCGILLSDKLLRDHLLKVHEVRESDSKARKTNVCTICSKVLASAKAAKIHEYRFHGIKMPPTWSEHYCTHCDFVTVQRADLRRHVLARHKNKASRCPQCNFICLETIELVNHKCEPEKACKTCDGRFLTAQAMAAHLERGCPGYNKNEELKAAKEIQALERKNQRYPCTEPNCNLIFTTASARTLHIKHRAKLREKLNLRENEDIYWKCEECGKICPSRNSLSTHKRLHKFRNGEVEGKTCEICGFTAFTGSKLKRHMKQKHLEK